MRRATGRSRRFPVARPRAGFSPLDLSPEAWYRGDSVVTVSDAVATWTDKSGNSRDLTQATATSRPALVTRAGQAALSFDGGDWLSGAMGSSLAQPLVHFVVFEPSVVSSSSFFLFDGGATDRQYAIWDGPNTSFDYYAGTEVSSGVALTADTITAACVVFNGATSALYLNDFAAPADAGSAGTNALSDLTIGARTGSGAAALTGYVWEHIIVSGDDATNRAKVAAYFNGRYTGLQVAT